MNAGDSTLRIQLVGVLAAAFSLIGLAGCGGDSSGRDSNAGANKTHQGNYPYVAVATVGMVHDIVAQVAGDKATVSLLIGEGVDPHQHNPTRSDMKELIDADIVFYSGLLLEGRMTDRFTELGRNKPVIAVTDGIDSDRLLKPEGVEGHADPHVWMDVSMWSECVDTVAVKLAKFDPTNADYYRANAKEYQKELALLDGYVRDVIASVPRQQRILITAHDAFEYFGRAYDIEVTAPQGISTESEASLDDVNRLVQTIVDRKVSAIFVESSVNPKTIQSIIEGAAKRGHEVRIGGTLFSDAMGRSSSYEGTYLGMIDHNASVIASSLGGEVPDGGRLGRLSLGD